MSQDFLLEIETNEMIAPNTFRLTFCHAPKIRSGQFVNVEVEGATLRRPFSVFDYDDKTEELTIVYKVVGGGTDTMSNWKKGDKKCVLMPLGNGFDTESAKSPLLIGGGVGGAPLVYLAKEFACIGIKPTAIIAARSKADIAGLDKMLENYANVIVATDDGTQGEKGNVVEVLERIEPQFDRYFCCGPTPMMRAVAKWNGDGDLCLEARMGCGFGACVGCTIKTTKGFRRVCKDGPVFDAREVIWND